LVGIAEIDRCRRAHHQRVAADAPVDRRFRAVIDNAVVARAQRSGATVREPLSTFVSGDRFASIRDPYGVRWSVMTRVEDLSEEESTQRVADWAAKQS